MSYLKNFIPINRAVGVKRSESSAEAEVLLPDYYPPVMRIIRAEAVPFVRTQTAYGDKLSVEGNVEFRVLYQSDDGGLNSFFYKAPFSHAADVSEIKNAVPTVAAELDFKDVRALSPQKLSLRATVLLSVSATVGEDAEILSDDGTPDGNIATLSSEESFCRQIGSVSKTLRHSGEISLEKKPAMERIIRYDIVYSDTDFKPMGKKTLVKSDMTLKIVYLSPETKKPAFIEEKTVVSQSLDIEIPDGNTAAVISPQTADCRFDLKENSEGKITAIEYSTETTVNFSLFEEKKAAVITDAFGIGKEIETEKSEVFTEEMFPQKQTVSFEETADIGEFSEIFDVSAVAVGREATFDKENHISEFGGEFLVNILYADRDGEVVSADRKIPFSLKREAGDCVAARQALDVAVSSVKYEAAENLRLSVECSVSGAVFLSKKREVITGISEKEEKPEDDGSNLVLYYAQKGEKLWDIAKKYRTPPEKICEENGISGNFIEEERMIFIPRFI